MHRNSKANQLLIRTRALGARFEMSREIEIERKKEEKKNSNRNIKQDDCRVNASLSIIVIAR